MSCSETVLLDYYPDIQEFYQKLCHLPGFVLLESTDRYRGRYDILSAYPFERIKINENTINPMDTLQRITQALYQESSETDLPFQGGAIGYISYDLGARLFNIVSSPQNTLKNMPLLDLGLYDWAIIVDHHLKKVTLFAANRHASTAETIKEILKLWNNLIVKNVNFKIQTDFYPLITRSDYEEAFHAIQGTLQEGRSYQVNYTQPFNAAYEGDDWEIYKRISAKNPVPFSCFIRTDQANILSFSPERFLLYDKGKLLSSPIKGTIERSNDPILDEKLSIQLTNCAKNSAENVMIVDLLRNDFGKIAKTGTVKVSNLRSIQSFNSVHHLVSDIHADCLEDIHPFTALMSCFPGGSITGAPKLESMRIINEHEPFSRGVYCGSIGYFSHHGRGEFNIAIRTMTATDEILHLAAGGGIVIDSNCDDEYRECYTKIAAIINVLK